MEATDRDNSAPSAEEDFQHFLGMETPQIIEENIRNHVNEHDDIELDEALLESVRDYIMDAIKAAIQ